MKPIYFPFTCISDRVAVTLAACFGSFAVYQPVIEKLPVQMQLWQERGVMEVRVPVSGNNDELKQAIKRYRIWANFQGEDLSESSVKLKARMDSMSALSNFKSSQIVAEIKDQINGKPNTRNLEPTLMARIFLYFAQEFDRQNHELTKELARYDQAQTELIRQLKIEDDPLAGEFASPPMHLTESRDDFLIADRLEAWTHLFLQDAEASGLLITHSPAALAYLLDRVSNAVPVMQTGLVEPENTSNQELADWREKMVSRINRFVRQKQDGSALASLHPTESLVSKNNNTLTVYQVPDQTPREVFMRCTRIGSSTADQANFYGEIRNTLVALIRI